MTAAKPADRRQNRERGDLQVIQGRAPTVIPDPPDDLLPEIEEAWFHYWESEMAQVVTLATDLPGLRRLFRYYDDLERTWALYRAQPEATGSMGQTKISHWAKHAHDTEAIIQRLEDRYGLSPKSRLELGVTYGDAARSLEDLYARATQDPRVPTDLFAVVPPTQVGDAADPDQRKPAANVRPARRVVDRGDAKARRG